MSDRLALIIANSEYDDPKLARLVTPSRDAEALADVLSDPAVGGFDVTRRVNETLPVVRRDIARLYQRRKKGDLLLLYYSGHGIKDDFGDLYLAVKDTETDVVSATAIDAAFVRDQLDKSGSQRKVVVLDCCHSGAFVGSGAKAALGSSAGTQEALAGSGYGRVILTASNAVEFAWEGDQLLGEVETSVFTHFLVQGLRTGAADRDGDGMISLDELYDYVYEQVVTSGLSRQTPQKWAQKVEGRIVIAQNPHRVVRPAELPPELRQAIESPLAGVREGVVSELERLLHGSDQGLALAAQAALTRLADDDSRRVSAAATRALGLSPVAGPAQPSPAPPPVVEKPPSEKPKPPAKPAPDVLTITSPIHPELVRVPAGEFLMGSDPAKDGQAYDDEQPQHRVYVSEFYIGRYPVTNTQFGVFVKATNYRTTAEKEGGGWVWTGSGWEEVKGANWQHPQGPQSHVARKDDHPVVLVSWDDAIAFCQWLSRETGQSFRLPTEAEWEKAARGTEGRIYPWGNEWDATKLNSGETGPGDTTPVGQYSPRGDSPYDCTDMAGNVWEWCADWYDAREYQRRAKSTVKDPQGPEKGESRVLRGGAFNLIRWNVRCASRGSDFPLYRYRNGGFRVVVSLVISPLAA